MGGGVFELGNPEGRGGGLQQFWKFRWKGGSKNHAFSHGGVDFSWNNPLFQLHVSTDFKLSPFL